MSQEDGDRRSFEVAVKTFTGYSLLVGSLVRAGYSSEDASSLAKKIMAGVGLSMLAAAVGVALNA